MKSRTMFLAAAAFGLAFLSGCSSGKDRPVVEAVAEQSGDVQKVTVKTHTYYFEPNRIVVKMGVPVELTIKNSSLIVPHNFTLKAPEAGIDIDRSVGMLKGSGVVEFTPTKPGEYEFICGKGGHMMKGMTGVLVVRE
jgi:plastocyanin domain-containing protein